jgi:molecular chaperone GrpE
MKDENKKIRKNEEQESEELKNQPESNENGNKEEADIRLSELEKEVAELKDKFLRKVAEFENYKRRTENDQLNLIKYSAAAFIRNCFLLLMILKDH